MATAEPAEFTNLTRQNKKPKKEKVHPVEDIVQNKKPETIENGFSA